MNCPKCGSKTKVLKNVINAPEEEMYRQRVCLDCGNKFYTVEYEVIANESFKRRWCSLIEKYRAKLRAVKIAGRKEA